MQQNAFMWFKKQYGKTPQDAGYKAAVSRTKRLFYFFRFKQVVFAPSPEIAQAFIKQQTILEKIVSYFVPTALTMVGFLCLTVISLATLSNELALVGTLAITGIGISAIIALVIFGQKAKTLQKIHQNRIIVYTA